jgi:hypothetical protein
MADLGERSDVPLVLIVGLLGTKAGQSTLRRPASRATVPISPKPAARRVAMAVPALVSWWRPGIMPGPMPSSAARPSGSARCRCGSAIRTSPCTRRAGAASTVSPRYSAWSRPIGVTTAQAGWSMTLVASTRAFARCEAANKGDPITVFEITTAAALLLFSECPADVLLLEVGLLAASQRAKASASRSSAT